MPLRSTATFAAIAALALATAPAHATPAAATASAQCFLSSDWENWSSPSPDVIYLRINTRDIYRLDLSSGSQELREPGVHLVNRMVDSEWVCSPLDLQLAVAEDHGGIGEPLFVKSMSKLTPDEIHAIPAKYLP